MLSVFHASRVTSAPAAALRLQPARQCLATSRTAARYRRRNAATHLTHPRRIAAELAAGRAEAELAPAAREDEANVDEQTWTWRGHCVSYERLSSGTSTGPPICIVHGFGSNARHFRRLTTALARRGYNVYAPDLLGFGKSAKPALAYTPALWAAQIADFLREVVRAPAVLVGNSIGSQCAIITAADAPDRVRGLCLLNVSAGMNQKGLYGDSALLAAMAPLFGLVEWLLRKPSIARSLFNSFRSKPNVEKILREQVYKNAQQVDDALVDTLYGPSEDPGAIGVFVEVFTGDPGPRPELLAEAKLRMPIQLIWGEQDAWTPADGVVARAFRRLAEQRPEQVEFRTIPRCGHVPYDDCPQQVLELALPWLDRVSAQRDAP